ncbi:hypothetical protein ACH5RR_000601 [Cinchona calisaya]|uniref:Uncharacterized protein n=1 Tax=Cinchona calisaya TaxID=153742 RepID=A0ABD3B133_9GENT
MNMDNISFKGKSNVCAEKENIEHGMDDSNSALKFIDLDYEMVDEDCLDFDIEWGTEEIQVDVGNKSVVGNQLTSRNMNDDSGVGLRNVAVTRKDNMIDELNDTSVDDMQSEYGSDSDGLRSPSESSEENDDNSRKQPKYHVFNEKTDMKDPVFKVGMLFKSVKEFRAAIRAHSTKDGRNVRFKKNESKRIRAICEGCNWRISASTKQASELVGKINKDLNVEVTLRKAYRAKQRVRIMVEGIYNEQYEKLENYCEELRRANPGPNGGQLLTAIGMDSIYPIAYAVVGVENFDNWSWFLGLLVQDLKIREQEKWCVITDKQKGLQSAVYEKLLGAEHRHCVQHLYCNFKKLHKGLALKERLWKCATASYVNQFNAEMDGLKAEDEAAHAWLSDKPSRFWSPSHFRTYCQFCPRVFKKFEKEKNKTNICIPRCAGRHKYKITCMYGDQYAVDLEQRTCTCRRWDLSGLPCNHAISAIYRTTEKLDMYVDDCYKKEAYLRSYEPVVNPVSGHNGWPKTGLVVQPPNYGRGPGRPKKLRRKDPEELRKSRPIVNPNKPNLSSKVGGKIRCSYCQEYAGHNKTSCPKRAFDLGTNNDTHHDEIKESSASMTFEVIGVSVPQDPTLTGQDVSVQSNHLGLNPAKFQPFTRKGGGSKFIAANEKHVVKKISRGTNRAPLKSIKMRPSYCPGGVFGDNKISTFKPQSGNDKSLENSFRANSFKKKLKRGIPQISLPDIDKALHEHAVVITSTGGPGSNVNTIEVGWITNNKIAPGAGIQPLSTYHGSQFEVTALVWKDPKQGVWWLRFVDEDVGYWSASLFTTLIDSATLVHLGGEVATTELSGPHTTTTMGSGHFAEEGFGGASSIKNLQVVDGSSTLRPPGQISNVVAQISYVVPNPNCYNSPDGDTIDCVDIYHQPAFDHPLLKNRTIQMRPSNFPKGLFGESNMSTFKPHNKNDRQPITQLWQLNGKCPEGTIPIRRTTQEGLLVASSIKKKLISSQTSSFDDAYHEHAGVFTSSGKYYGAKATINAWNPKVQDDNDFSLSQIWIVGGSGPNLNTIEVGWIVFPGLFGDSNTRLFTYWTRDGYQNTGCYNLRCSGFVQTSKRVALGTIIYPLSVYHGSQFDITLLVWKDSKDKWWLQFGDEIVGYWPASLFTSLADNASQVQLGGEVSTAILNGPHTTTQMGSGHFSEETFGGASYFKNLHVVDSSNNLKPPGKLDYLITKPNCYNLQADYSDVWEDYFFYGGPGRNPNCP